MLSRLLVTEFDRDYEEKNLRRMLQFADAWPEGPSAPASHPRSKTAPMAGSERLAGGDRLAALLAGDRGITDRRRQARVEEGCLGNEKDMV